MPNTFAPNGLSEQTMDGTIGSFNYTKKYIDPTNTQQIFKGDLVIQLNTGKIRQYQPADTGQVAGIFAGCEYASAAGGYVFSKYWPGAGAALPGSTVTAFVVTAPAFQYSIQTGPANSLVPLTPTGFDINFTIGYGIGTGTAGNGNVTTGFSTAFLDLTTASPSVTTRPLRVIDFTPGVPGTINGYDETTPFNIVTVALNFADTRVLTGTSTSV